MTRSPIMKINKEDIDPKNITRNIMGGSKKEESKYEFKKEIA